MEFGRLLMVQSYVPSYSQVIGGKVGANVDNFYLSITGE
jgi:hypothetical protein